MYINTSFKQPFQSIGRISGKEKQKSAASVKTKVYLDAQQGTVKTFMSFNHRPQ
jgi:hypothetical protein